MDTRLAPTSPRPRRHRRSIAAAALAMLALGTLSATTLAADASVAIEGFAFSPQSVTVNVGDTVTWTNGDAAPHTATAGDGSFDTGTISQGQSGSATFDTAGTFAYICEIHPTMTGTVEVQGAAPTDPPATDPPGSTDAPSVTNPPTDTGAPAAAGAPNVVGILAFILAAMAVALGLAMRRTARSR